MKLCLVEVDELPELLEFAKSTFIEAFGDQNSEEDMALYVNQKFTMDQIRIEFMNESSRFYTVKRESAIIAYLKLNAGDAQSEEDLENALEIERLYVRKDFQNRNIGQFLINECVNISREEGYEYLWLGVWEENVGAIRFYERNGFIPFGKHEFKLGNDLQQDLLLRRQLKSIQSTI